MFGLEEMNCAGKITAFKKALTSQAAALTTFRAIYVIITSFL